MRKQTIDTNNENMLNPFDREQFLNYNNAPKIPKV